jgi:hypothetical protein
MYKGPIPSFNAPAVFRVGDDVRTPLGRKARVTGYTGDGRIDVRYYADNGLLDRRQDIYGTTVALHAKLLTAWRPLR